MEGPWHAKKRDKVTHIRSEGILVNQMMNKIASNVSLNCFYTNADQFVNKRDALLMMISDDRPDLILITEVIPKKQVKAITDQLLDIDGYTPYYNFDPNNSNLGTSGIRGVAIYVKETLNATEVKI